MVWLCVESVVVVVVAAAEEEEEAVVDGATVKVVREHLLPIRCREERRQADRE